MFVVSKAVLPVVPPFTLLTLRLVLGSLALGVVYLRVRTRSPRPPRHGLKAWAAVALAGLVGYGISLGLQLLGTDLSTASNAALVTCATPVFVALFAVPVLGQKLGPRSWGALALAAAGVLAVIGWGSFSANFWGNLLLVGAALTWALYSVLTARAARGLDLTLTSLVGFWGGLPFSLSGAAWELCVRGFGPIDGSILAGILFLGVVSTALAMLLWNYAFRVLPASTAGLTFFAQPVTGTLLGTLFLGETPGIFFYFGALLIAGALILGRK
jgi:drug/metabolite transporter (DMT)-like permease